MSPNSVPTMPYANGLDELFDVLSRAEDSAATLTSRLERVSRSQLPEATSVASPAPPNDISRVILRLRAITEALDTATKRLDI